MKMIRPATLVVLSLSSTAIAAPCTLCIDGVPYTKPDAIISVPLPGQTEATKVSCSDVDIFVPVMFPDENSEGCELVHRLSTACGCPITPSSCHLCPNKTTVPNPDVELPQHAEIFGAVPTCLLFEAYTHSFTQEESTCSAFQRDSAETCGCNISMLQDETPAESNSTDVPWTPPTIDLSILFDGMFGVETQRDADRQSQVIHASAALSIFGAVSVIFDCLRKKRKKLKNVYNQIMLCMACSDIFYSFAWALGDLMTPSATLLESTTSDHGTDATCALQGWMIQVGGMTSLFLNATLGTFYLLVVMYNFPKTKLKKLRKYLIGIPLVLGQIFSFAAIPYISQSFTVCHLVPPHEILESGTSSASTWAPILGLFVVPGFVVMAYSTITMVVIYRHVRKLGRKTEKWTFRARFPAPAPASTSPSSTNLSSDAMSRTRRRRAPVSGSGNGCRKKLQVQVLWQSVFYLSALYICWFVYLLLILEFKKLLFGYFKLWTTVYFLVPLQGFLNSSVYFRPRISARMTAWLAAKERRAQTLRELASREQDLTPAASMGVTNSNVDTGLTPENGAKPFVSVDLAKLHDESLTPEDIESSQSKSEKAVDSTNDSMASHSALELHISSLRSHDPSLALVEMNSIDDLNYNAGTGVVVGEEQ